MAGDTTYAKKKSRLSYSVMFKLAAVCFAEKNGNRASARYLGINEKQIRDWRSKKNNLIHSDANAKRLKGNRRDALEFKYNFDGRFLGDNDDGKASEATTLKDSDCQQNIERMKKPQLFGLRQESMVKTKLRDQWPSILSAPKEQGKTESYSSREFNEEKCKRRRESDFNERISCALALLDLQTAII